jgi:hypothetical protein
MYMKQKYELPEGFVDLSEEIKPMMGMEIFSEPEMEEEKDEKEDDKEYSYPSLYFSNAEGLKDLPKEGTATIYFKKTMERTETITRDGKTKKNHCVELCICGIKAPKATAPMKMDAEDEIENGLNEAEEEED